MLQQLVADRSKLFHAGDLTVVSQVINDFSVQGFNINDFRHMDFVYADAALHTRQESRSSVLVRMMSSRASTSRSL